MVSVNKNKCIGCGLCTEICDEVFYLEDDGKAKARPVDKKDAPHCVKQAVEQCPVGAISQ
jgi:ferredoxin